MAIRSLILTIGAKDESLSKTLEKIGALGAKTKDDLANLGSDVNTKAAEKQIDDLAAAIKKSQTNTENLATAARQTSTGIELVGGVSRLTKTELDQVNRTLQTGLDAYRALGQEAPKDLQKIADAVSRQKEALSGTGKTLGGVTEQSGLLGKATSLLSGQLLALAGPAALGAAVKQSLDYADTLVKMSDRTGIGVVAIQRLEAIAKASGNSIEDVAGAVNKFQKGIAEGKLDEPINRLGLSVQALRAQSPDEQFISIAKAIQRITDPAEQARTAMELFGRSGGDLLPSLKADVDKLADSTVKMSEESVKALDDFGDALGRLKTSTINIIGNQASTLLSIASDFKAAARDLLNAIPKGPIGGDFKLPPNTSFERPDGSTGLDITKLPKPAAPAPLIPLDANRLPEFTSLVLASSNAVSKFRGELADAAKAAAEAARELDVINKKIAEAQAPIVELTDKQKNLAVQYKSFGLSAQEIGIKLGVSARSVDAFTTSLKLHAEVLKTVESAAFGLTGSVGPLTENLAASASEMSKLHTKISGIEEDAHVAAFGFKGMADGLGAVGTKSTELEDVKEHLKDSADQAKRNAEEAAKAGKGISDLAQAFAQLSQVSGGSLGEVVQEIGNVISALDLATKAVKAYGEASTLASKAAAVASGIAAGAQATGSGSTISRVGGGALTGASIGSVIPGIGTAFGAGIGATVGLIRGLLAGNPEKQINKIRDAFVEAHGGLAALNEEAHRAGRTLDGLLNAKNAKDYNAAINDLNASFSRQDKITAGIADLGFKSRTELKQAAVDAQDVFEFMRQSGEFTAEQVGEAFKKMREAQAAAGDAAAEAELKAQQASLDRIATLQKGLDDLTARRDGLAASVANEAPEEVMGVIEAATRGQISVLDEEIRKQREQLRIASEGAANDFEDAIGNIDIPTIHVPVTFDIPDFPRIGEQPEGASTGGLVTRRGIQHFSGGGVVLPFMRRGSDTVPAMLTPGEVVLNKDQQRALNVALSGALKPVVDTAGMESRLGNVELLMGRLTNYLRYDFKQDNAIAVKEAVQKVRRA